MKPSVSIIVPVFKVEQYIGRCCRSLFGQTMKDLEYIFVDDCSPDSSIKTMLDVLAEFPERKEQVRVIRMDRNSGQAAVRKRGLEEASGEYVIHCDSDDWADVEMYARLFSKAKEDDADIVTCDFFRSDGDTGRYCSAGFRNERTYSYDLVAKRAFPALWNKLIRRSLFQNSRFVHPSMNMGEDYAITAQIAAESRRVSYIPEALYWYFNNPVSITKDKSVENVRTGYLSSVGNINLVEDSFRNSGIIDRYARQIQAARIMDRFYLLRDYVNCRDVMDLWRESSADIPLMSGLFNREAQLKARLMSLLIELRIYQLFN